MGAAVDASCRPFRQLARNARLANARLDRACAALSDGEWDAPRASFFPSLRLTMVHLLSADRFYAEALRGAEAGVAAAAGERRTPADFAGEREAVDQWFVDFCDALTPAALAEPVRIRWPDRMLAETRADTLLHVFLHGQHHRGQVHAMLSGTSVPPPQIDEFILAQPSDLRAGDLARLGWNERDFKR